MASLQVPDETVYLHESVVRGHHVYKTVWSPVVGEILQLSCNNHDRFSVSMMKAEFVVGHSPRRLSRTVWHFLRYCGKATCEVTGRRKFGKVPCLYSISSLLRVALSLCLARMLVVEGTLLERLEWIRSFCHLGRTQKSLIARTRF